MATRDFLNESDDLASALALAALLAVAVPVAAAARPCGCGDGGGAYALLAGLSSNSAQASMYPFTSS